MIVGVIRIDGGDAVELLHPGVTHVQGLDAGARRAWADALTRALSGNDTGAFPIEVEVEVELEGRRQPLTAALAKSLAVGDAARSVVVVAADLPGATPKPEPLVAVATPAADDLAGLEAEVATAEARVAQLRNERAAADRSATEAVDAFMTANRRVDKDADTALGKAEERHATAVAALADAKQALADAEVAARSHADTERSSRDQLSALRAERTRLETDRTGLVARMVAVGDPGDPAPVEAALAALRRLRQVKPKPSTQAVALADRWSEAVARLGALPQPPQPPEWLVIPALAALHEAKDAVAATKANAEPVKIDPAKIEALDRAHREVLEAEQRSMRKGSRMHRRRLDAAHAAEQEALASLGVRSYGEYLQRMAPGADPGGGPDRLAAAEAGLADAEAVWEELHGGQASPEWTEAKEAQASIRLEAHALLGRDVDDRQLEAELRSHVEAVVETGWAEQELSTALQQAGVATDAGDDLEVAADRWLAESPGSREERAVLAEQLDGLDTRLATVEAELAESQSDAFFGQSETGESAGAGNDDVLRRLTDAVASAERHVLEAERAVATAREGLAASDHEQGRIAGLEADADARRRAVDELAAQLHDAEADLERVRSTSEPRPDPGKSGDSGPSVVAEGSAEPGFDLSAVVGMEAEAYLLARVAALRGASAGPLPLVVDVDAVAGLSDGAARRVLRLLGRLSSSMQIVVLGDDDKVATWAEGLGDQAAVRAVAR